MALAMIVLAGLALRTWGISWGLPDRLNIHPDEYDYVMKHALAVSWSHSDPGFLNYPSFIMYLIALTFGLLQRLGLTHEIPDAFLVGRAWSAFFGTATIWAVYRLARALRARPAGALLAALWMALLPLNIWESHAAITDTLMAFWATMTLWASVRLVGKGRQRDYAFAGACLGLATGSKYTAAMAVVAVVVGALASRRPPWHILRGLCLAAIAALALAFLVAPWSFIRFPDTLKAINFEYLHTHSQHLGFNLSADGHQYNRYIYQLVAAWPFSLGIALYASALAGLLPVCVRAGRRILPLFLFAAVFFGVTGSWSFVPLRYYMPLVVLGALFAGLWHGALLGSGRPVVRVAGVMVVAATFGYTALFAVQTTSRYANDTRVAAERWLDATLKPGSRLVVGGWSRYCALPTVLSNFTIVGARDERPVLGLKDVDPFDLLEISSMHFNRHIRQGHQNLGQQEAYRRLRESPAKFELVKRFEASFINKRLYARLDPMFESYFVSPTLEFYRRKTPANAMRQDAERVAPPVPRDHPPAGAGNSPASP